MTHDREAAHPMTVDANRVSNELADFEAVLEAAPNVDPYEGRRMLLLAGAKLREAIRRPSLSGGEAVLHGPYGWLNGLRGLSEDSWTLEMDPLENNEEYFAIPLYAKVDPFVEVGIPAASPVPLEGVTVKGAAVKLIENRISEIVNEYGDYEPDTNFTNLPEWAETVIEELENLLSAIVGSAK